MLIDQGVNLSGEDLLLACSDASFECVKLLLSINVDIIKGWQGDTPLHEISKHNNTGCLKLLL